MIKTFTTSSCFYTWPLTILAGHLYDGFFYTQPYWLVTDQWQWSARAGYLLPPHDLFSINYDYKMIVAKILLWEKSSQKSLKIQLCD